MLFGAAYYPEHWPKDRWEIDAKMMQEAGINVVRMAEFAWCKMQPKEDVFDFGWLDEAIEVLAKNSIKTILGTPTAAPPKWLVDKCPDIHMLDEKGHVRGFGSRRYYCYNNKAYHEYTKKIVKKMAEHYAKNKNVIAWQIDNEFGCANTARCYCEDCRKKFIDWLKERYKTIDNLNEQWGTIFSGQAFSSWGEIILPVNTAMGGHNPSLLLDFRRFSSDSVVAYQKIQLDILKDKVPNQVVTTNFMGLFNEINYFDLAKDLDLVSLDIYPNISNQKIIPTHIPAMSHDIMRGLKTQNYWVTEHQSGAPGGYVLHRTPKPGEMRRWTYQSISHGADAIMYFRWRTVLFGIEEYWHGILNHDGLPNRRYEEVKKIGRELNKIGPYIYGSVIKSEVALVRSYDLEWVFDIQPHAEGYKYIKHFSNYYRYFYDNNIPVDIVSPDADLSAYKLVIAPNFIMAKEDVINNLYGYVKNGGYLILDFRAGAKEWNNRMAPYILPGKFKDLLGIEIRDYGIIKDFENVEISYAKDEKIYKAAVWYDVVEPKAAVGIGFFLNDYFKGHPAITYNEYGEGKAYYFATGMESRLMDVILNEITNECSVINLLCRQEGVEVVRRVNKDIEYLFVINHNTSPVEIPLDSQYKDLLNDGVVTGGVTLEKNEVLVLQKLIGLKL